MLIGLLIILIVLFLTQTKENLKLYNYNNIQIDNNLLSSDDRIPKVIWTYWDKPRIPFSVKVCFDSWKKYNPLYTIVFLSNDNIQTYLPDENILKLKFATTPARTSDFIRSCILTKYGGIWADANILMTKPLSSVIPKNAYFFGYYLDSQTHLIKSPVLENWFFACSKNNRFMRTWRDVFLSINNFETVKDYVKFILKHTNKQGITDTLYLTMHLAAQYVFQNYNPNFENFYLLPADLNDGPFVYLSNNSWRTKPGMNNLLNLKKRQAELPPIIKFTRHQRQYIDDNNYPLDSLIEN